MQKTDEKKGSIPWRWKPILILIALTITMYAPFIGDGFTTDDFVHIRHIQGKGNPLTVSPFGLYRPVVSLSFFFNWKISGLNALPFRFTNLFFHLLVVWLLYLFARLYSKDDGVAFLSVLAFVMTPKAHVIGVNWISGRTELLMAVFSLLAIICWIRYQSVHHKKYLLFCSLCYMIAVLSKENATLLPVILFFLSPKRDPIKKRLINFLILGSALGAVLLLRYHIGALMPVSQDFHYNLLIPLGIIGGNIVNYFFRSLPPVVLLLLFTGLPLCYSRKKYKKKDSRINREPPSLKTLLFSGIWFAAFILPVSPIRMRSELYLYIAGFGFCMAAASWINRFLKRDRLKIPVTAGLVLFVLVSGFYIIGRNIQANRKAAVSHRFIGALAGQLPNPPGNTFIYIKPGDRETETHLREAIDGYFDIIVKVIYNRRDIHGRMAYEGDFPHHEKKVFTVTCRNGDIMLTPENP